MTAGGKEASTSQLSYVLTAFNKKSDCWQIVAVCVGSTQQSFLDIKGGTFAPR